MKLKEESGEEKVLNWEDTKKMPFTSRVLQETLRVASILSFTFREAVEDVEYEGQFFSYFTYVIIIFSNQISNNYDVRVIILRLKPYLFFLIIGMVKSISGYLIPKGWKVLPLFRNIHHSPEIFPEPEKFDPTRFEVSIEESYANSHSIFLDI